MRLVVDRVAPAARGVRSDEAGEDLRDGGRVVVRGDLGVASHGCLSFQAFVRLLYVAGQQLLATRGIAGAQGGGDRAVVGDRNLHAQTL